MSRNEERLNILLVGDDPRKVGVIRDALEQSGTRCRLHTVGTGSSMAKYLQRKEPYVDAPQPHLILFDFLEADERHLETLGRIKADRNLDNLPIVVLTVPATEQMLERAHANPDDECVMFSPIELNEFLRSMNAFRIDRFVNAVKLLAKLGFVLVRVKANFDQPVPTVSNGERHRIPIAQANK